jgi:hypothetical protein
MGANSNGKSGSSMLPIFIKGLVFVTKLSFLNKLIVVFI